MMSCLAKILNFKTFCFTSYYSCLKFFADFRSCLFKMFKIMIINPIGTARCDMQDCGQYDQGEDSGGNQENIQYQE